jgi:phosphonate transport system substrate-binding protein
MTSTTQLQRIEDRTLSCRLSRRRVLRTLARSGMAAVAWSAVGQPALSATQALSVSIVPQFPAADLHRDWVPLLARLSREVGVGLKLVLTASIPRFEAELMAGGPDLAFMNPYHQVMAMRQQGYVPMVRSGRLLSGILVVRRDSDIQSVAALDGHDLVFPAPNAFGASLWMRALLTEREGIHFRPHYVQTHSNVYRQVIRGKATAGGGVNNTLAQETAAVRQDLRVLLETPGAPAHPLSAHPRVPAGLRTTLTAAMLHLASDDEGRQLLNKVSIKTPVAADYAQDYGPLEHFRLEKYVVV